MGPEEETVEEAQEKYMFALQNRLDASELARQNEWNAHTERVIQAREAFDDAKRRAEGEEALRRAFELLDAKTVQRRINGL